MRCSRMLRRRLCELALGIERLGLLSLRFPAAVAFVAAVLALTAGFGIPRIRIYDSLSRLFIFDTPLFKQGAGIAALSLKRI